MWATLWNARRPPWSQYPPDQGPGSGIWRSTDGGKTWSEAKGKGLPGTVGRIGLAVAPGGQRIYAIVDATTGGGLYRSDDGGGSWTLVNTDPRVTTRGWYFGRVFLDPKDPDVVYVPKVAIMKSTDGGAHFQALKGAPGGDDYHFLWIDPTAPERMVCAVDQGTIVSLDGGRTWSSWYNQPTAQFYHVATDDAFPYRIYGAQQDAGTVSITSRSDFGVITFRDWIPAGAGEGGYFAPDPADPDIAYGGDTYGRAFRWDRRTGQTQDVSPVPVAPFGTPMDRLKYRFTWTSPMVFDPLDAKTMYMGAQMVLKTVDGGLHWTEASPDLTTSVAEHRGQGVVYTIAPSPVKEGVIWAGTDNGRIHVTRDGGATWKDVTPTGVQAWSKMSLIDASPFDAGGAYVAVERHRRDDLTPMVFRTHDYGATWQRADGGLPQGAFVRAVRADPVREGLLYAGTEQGVFTSFDDGAHWQPLMLNLPRVPVRDLAIHGTDLIAATHGRSFWVLDDVTPLRTADADSARLALRVAPPADAVRMRRTEYHDTPLPVEEPHGENPPDGAVIDYWLGSTPAGPVTLEIVDGAGTVVRRYASDDAAPEHPPQQFSDDWLPKFRRLTTHPGHNRFVWDLRWPQPPAPSYDYSISGIPDRGTVTEPEGPLALPGTYTVRVTAGGVTRTQPLRVVMDPRVKAAEGVLADQLKVAMDTWNALAEATALRAAAGTLRARLGELDRASLDGGQAKTLDGLVARLSALVSASPASGLATLETIVQGADREPTAQARASLGGADLAAASAAGGVAGDRGGTAGRGRFGGSGACGVCTAHRGGTGVGLHRGSGSPWPREAGC